MTGKVLLMSAISDTVFLLFVVFNNILTSFKQKCVYVGCRMRWNRRE